MPKYHIYIREDVDLLLQKEARRHGVTPKDIVRMRIERMSTALQSEALFDEVRRCHEAVIGLFKLVENLAPEIGYISGVSRVSTEASDAFLRPAQSLEKHFKSLAAAIKQALERTKQAQEEG